MRDEAVTAPLAGALLIGILLLAATATYFVVTSFGTDPQPIYGDIEGRACSTTGRWTVARFGFNSLSGPLRPDDLVVHATTGRSTADPTDPIVLTALVEDLRAGNRLWLTTQPDRTGDINCGSTSSLTFLHEPSGEILARATHGTSAAYAFAISDVECDMGDDMTTVSLTIERVPPGLQRNDLIVVDPATGAATNATGDLRLKLSGGSGVLQPGDDMTIETRKHQQDKMSCTDPIRFIDEPSGATLREHTLT